MAGRDNTLSTTTADPSGPANTNEIAPPSEPSPGEIQESAQRILASLSEEKRSRLRDAVMITMTEEQRRQAAATKKDPLMQFIFQKARSDIMNGTTSAQIGVRQQQQQQQQQGTNMAHGTVFFTTLPSLMTQVPHNGFNTAAATNTTQIAPGANASLDSEHH